MASTTNYNIQVTDHQQKTQGFSPRAMGMPGGVLGNHVDTLLSHCENEHRQLMDSHDEEMSKVRERHSRELQAMEADHQQQVLAVRQHHAQHRDHLLSEEQAASSRDAPTLSRVCTRVKEDM